MAHFFIATQVLENYGAHNGSGKFVDGATDWKMKGGEDYIISGVDRVQDAVAFVAAIAMENGLGYKEFPTHWEEVDSRFETEFERNQREYDGEIAYPAKRIHVGEYMAERAKRG